MQNVRVERACFERLDNMHKGFIIKHCLLRDANIENGYSMYQNLLEQSYFSPERKERLQAVIKAFYDCVSNRDFCSPF